jgi:hypothetical protein
VVYLWVDGNDTPWRRKRDAAALARPLSSDLARYGDVEGRYRDNDELRYSLRALSRFFPEHGHVYIVTDNQTPTWLQSSQQVTLVDHRDLIPSSSLPTFDSGHIESYIHRISGLSERFFYCNDDVFFGAPVHLDDWFSPEGVYLTWSDDPVVSNEPLRRDANSLDNACRLSKQWMQDHPGAGQDPAYQHTFRTFAHAPRPLRKSVLFELETLAPELFAMARSTVFRSWDCPTIVSDFVLRWSLAQGRAHLREYPHAYVSTGDGNVQNQLSALSQTFGALAFFCINDTTDNAQDNDPRHQQVREVLQSLLPLASEFERSNLDPEQRFEHQTATTQHCSTLSSAGA